MVNLTNSFNYLQNKFHITTLEEKDKNYSSLALGGLTQGVTVEEMAGAYCTFVNSGKYISRILTQEYLIQQVKLFLKTHQAQVRLSVLRQHTLQLIYFRAL